MERLVRLVVLLASRIVCGPVCRAEGLGSTATRCAGLLGARIGWSCVGLLVVSSLCLAEVPETAVHIGSKVFTESVILGEIASDLVRSAGTPAVHHRQLGGTRILWNALVKGDIDVYPEYTGTITQEILVGKGIEGEEALRGALAAQGVEMSRSLGFNDTYALGMKEDLAARLGIRTVSDLRRHPELELGFSSEFMERQDGWPSLRERYGLPQRHVRGLDHDLAYRGLASGTIAVTDLYSTDAEIKFYGLRVLEDDLGHFPAYRAVFLMRADLRRRAPAAVAALEQLEGKISERKMIEMNARVKLEKQPESRVAARFLAEELGVKAEAREDSVARAIARRTGEHVFLVLVSLAASILVAIPLGILAEKRPRTGQLVLGMVGIFQTIPSLAILVFMIPLLGIGARPAIFAMFLYSLLPIVRNTYTGLRDIPLPTRESAEALGLPPGARLRLVELPMASRAILAGIKTSAVINVGTATLGALIGAGGYGQPILTGIRLADNWLILQGAVPAAVLALVVQGVFEIVERLFVPRGLRL
jgi:osmoprotectant transport system permease protein